MLAAAGAEARIVRAPRDLEGLDGLVIPGGESTTMTLGIEREGLTEPLKDLMRSGAPVLGTCAGMIMLDREHLDVLDIRARRNAFGRQVSFFETDLPGEGAGAMRAVFIRAPWVDELGDGVEVLAEVDGHPVAVRAAAGGGGGVLALAFDPELTGSGRLHQWRVDRIRENGAKEAA